MMMWQSLDKKVLAALLGRVFQRLGLRRPAGAPAQPAPTTRSAADTVAAHREARDV